MAPSPVRIAEGQPVATKAKQALMIGSQELGLFAYRQPYHLGFDDHRERLIHTLRTEFGRTVELPAPRVEDEKNRSRLVVYLIVVDGEPILIPEPDVLPFVFALALAGRGRAAAERVNYRPEMLTS